MTVGWPSRTGERRLGAELQVDQLAQASWSRVADFAWVQSAAPGQVPEMVRSSLLAGDDRVPQLDQQRR